MNRWVGLLLLIILSAGCRTASSPEFLLGGIQVNEPDHADWAQSLAHHGMNTVSVTVYAKQGDWDRDHLWWSEQEPAVVSEIRAAKAQGLKVVLILRVALDHAFERNRFLWHGMIHPAGPTALDGWFDQYSKFVLKWAQQAAKLNVDVLGVGSEMSALTSTLPQQELPNTLAYYLDLEAQRRAQAELLSFEAQIKPEHWAALGGGAYASLPAFLEARSGVWKDWADAVVGTSTRAQQLNAMNARRAHEERRWRQLIAEVRGVFGGKLTYAANFDQYHRVGFWDALDIIGINAYFQLRDASKPSKKSLEDELTEGWVKVLEGIDSVRRIRNLGNMPVLFTELGYTQHEAGTYEPWAMNGLSVLGPLKARRLYIWQDQPKAPQERAAAVRALERARTKFPGLLGGLLYWKFSTKPYHAPVEPFVLILRDDAQDPLQAALHQFSTTKKR